MIRANNGRSDRKRDFARAERLRKERGKPLLDHLKSVIVEHPGASLCAAVVIGFYLGRIVKQW